MSHWSRGVLGHGPNLWDGRVYCNLGQGVSELGKRMNRRMHQPPVDYICMIHDRLRSLSQVQFRCSRYRNRALPQGSSKTGCRVSLARLLRCSLNIQEGLVVMVYNILWPILSLGTAVCGILETRRCMWDGDPNRCIKAE